MRLLTVSALRGRRDEARQLGEASLRAFEYLLQYPQAERGRGDKPPAPHTPVYEAQYSRQRGSGRSVRGHVNAQAVREWLNQQAQAAMPASVSSLPERALPGEPEPSEPARRPLGFSLVLLLIGSFWFLFSLEFPVGR